MLPTAVCTEQPTIGIDWSGRVSCSRIPLGVSLSLVEPCAVVPTTVPTTIVYTVCLQLQQLLHLNVIDAYDFHNMHVVIRQPETRGGPRLVCDLCVTDTITPIVHMSQTASCLQENQQSPAGLNRTR